VSLGLLLLFGAPQRARADATVEALGSAPVTAGDVEGARRRALDDAFRQAVDQVIGQLVAPAVKQTHADTLKKRVIRRAKVYVTQHRVLDEGEDGGVYQIRLSAQVADGQLRQDLGALGVPLVGADPGQPGGDPGSGGRDLDPSGGGAGSPASTPRPKLAVLVTAEVEVPGLADRSARALAARGFEVVALPSRTAPVDDGAALGLGHAASARVVVVVAAAARSGALVRGTGLVGAELTLAFRVVDDDGGAPVRLEQGQGSGAGAGATVDEAMSVAAADAATRLGDALGPRLAARFPAPSAAASGEEVVIRLTAVRRWPEVAQVMKVLGGVAGVKRVSVRGAGDGVVEIAASGSASAKALASALAAGPPGQVKWIGPGRVELELAPPSSAAPRAAPGPTGSPGVPIWATP
jgi:hypothetical protein